MQRRWTWIAGTAAVLAVAALITQTAVSQPAEDAEPAPDGLQNTGQRMSYFIGFQVGSQFNQMGVEFDQEALLRGLNDSMGGEEMALSREQITEALTKVRQQQQAKAQKQAEENLAAAEAFMKKNAKRDEVKVTDSGLQYEVVEQGEGKTPDANDRVTVHYEGQLLDGEVFDSSYERDEPATFKLSQVIPGWSEGLQLMKPGAKYKLYVPPDLGYGASPRGPGGPNNALIFTVELKSVERIEGKKPEQPAGMPGAGAGQPQG
jgi:FKBP-type peptidyl-prolyl cis-trans isomerase